MGEPELASLLREHASRHSVPGAAIGVLRDGVVATAYSGVADTTTDEPVTSETRFAVGSLCKSMVATAVARLAEAGRLSLDDPIAAHVPELDAAQAGRHGRACATCSPIALGFRCARSSSSLRLRAMTTQCSRGS